MNKSTSIALRASVYQELERLLITTQAETGKRLTFSDMVQALLSTYKAADVNLVIQA